MTPAPHVPVNFLKAGGSAFFSAQCIALLAELGYDPDDFGTYDHVANRLSDARKKCRDYDQWVAAGKPPRDPEPPIPSRRERELGRPYPDDPDHYQSGHTGRNSAMQTERGNPCSNAVLGHEDNTYPCMPHQGGGFDPGTEHHQVTAAEESVPRERVEQERAQQEARGMPTPEGDPAHHGAAEGDGAAPRTTYDHETMEADADQRTNDLVQRRREQKQREGEAYGLGDDEWAERDYADGDSGDAAGAGSGDAPKDMMPEDKKIDGDSAEECINNFRKGAVSGLRSHAADEKTIQDRRDEAARLREKADDPATQAAHEEAQARQAAAQAAHDDAHRVRTRIGARLGGARNSLSAAERRVANAPNPPGPSQADVAKRDRAQARVSMLESGHQRAGEREQRTRDDLTSANRSAGAGSPESLRRQADHLDCLADQGEEIRNSPDPNHGRDGVVPTATRATTQGNQSTADSANQGGSDL